MKYGDPVVYEKEDGKEELAFVVKSHDGGAEADLALIGGGVVKRVARRAEGGGHTWRQGKL